MIIEVHEHIGECAVRADDEGRRSRALAGVQLVAARIRTHANDGINRRRPHVADVADDRPGTSLSGDGR